MKRVLILIVIILLFLTGLSLAEETSNQDIHILLSNRLDTIHAYFQEKPFSFTLLTLPPPIYYINKIDFTGIYSPHHGKFGAIKIGPSGLVDPRVVYHEYIHALINKIHPKLTNYRTYQSEAIEEGLPQYFACSYANDPKFMWGKEERTLANILSFPGDVKFETYQDSYILCGALWDMRERINNPLEADFLVYKAIYFKPKNFADMLTAILSVNDKYYGNNDNNLSNDPWSNRILNSFNKHGITMKTTGKAYSAKLIKKSQKLSTSPGEKVVLWAKFTNTGPAAWYNSKDIKRSDIDPLETREIWLSKIYKKIDLGYASNIKKSKKIARLQEKKVKLNETGTFKVVFKAPRKKGTYKYTFNPQALLSPGDNPPFAKKAYTMNADVSWEITVK